MCVIAEVWIALDVMLQFESARRAAVVRQHNVPSASANPITCGGVSSAQDANDIVSMVSDQDGIVDWQQILQPIPAVADDRRAAGSGLEQTHAGRPAGADHVSARDVERKALPAIELRMLRRRQMVDPLDVGRPVDRRRVLRSGDHEAPIGQPACRLNQQALQRRLPILCISAEIAEIPAYWRRFRLVPRHVDRAIEWTRRGVRRNAARGAAATGRR